MAPLIADIVKKGWEQDVGGDRGPAGLAAVFGYETLEGHASQGLAIVPL